MIKPLNGNWLDLVIILVLVYYATDAYRRGFLYIFADFISFLASFLISLRVYKFAADLFMANFNLPDTFANALGFIVVSIILESVFGYLLTYLINELPKGIRESKINRLLGLIPALGEGIILIAFLLTIIVALPLPPEYKRSVANSKIGSFIIKETGRAEKVINQLSGGVFDKALTY